MLTIKKVLVSGGVLPTISQILLRCVFMAILYSLSAACACIAVCFTASAEPFTHQANLELNRFTSFLQNSPLHLTPASSLPTGKSRTFDLQPHGLFGPVERSHGKYLSMVTWQHAARLDVVHSDELTGPFSDSVRILQFPPLHGFL